MQTIRTYTKQLQDFFHSSLPAKIILYLLAWGFPVFISLIGNYISLGTLGALQSLLTTQIGAFLFGTILLFLLYTAILFFSNRFWVAALVTGFLGILFPLIDHFKRLILQDHFYPWDLTLAQNAGSFTEFLGNISFPALYIVWILCTVVYVIFLACTKPKCSIHLIPRLMCGCVFVIALVGMLKCTPIRSQYETVFGMVVNETTDQNYLYANYGFFSAFALNFDNVDTLQPQDYSQETIETLFAEYVPEDSSVPENFAYPDVIVVLSEAFWDPTVLEGVTFSADPLQNYRAIAENHPSGQMVSCTFGGGTVRPEFEVLSGMSTSALPSGNMPYQQYLKEKTFAYAQLFKSIGYDTLGIHTYQKTFYERNRTYPLMGIDDFLGENDMHAELHWNSGPYITDQTIAEEIIYQLEQPHETGLYLTAITMENHSLYTDKFDASDWDIKVSGDNLSEQEIISLQNYCKGVSDSDKALGQLYEYIMQREKPTILLWYGDHLPTLGDDFSPYTSTGTIQADKAALWSDAEKNIMFRTPYLMFANYDTGRAYRAEGEAVSPYLLEALLCDYIGVPECLQTNFLLDVYETSPVMSRYYDLYTPNTDPDKREKMMELHRYLTYDELIGERYLDSMQGFDF